MRLSFIFNFLFEPSRNRGFFYDKKYLTKNLRMLKNVYIFAE